MSDPNCLIPNLIQDQINQLLADIQTLITTLQEKQRDYYSKEMQLTLGKQSISTPIIGDWLNKITEVQELVTQIQQELN